MEMKKYVEEVAKISNEVLLGASEAYYSGNPVMGDELFDSLEADLAGLVKMHPEVAPLATVLSQVGTDTPGRVKHEYPMRSIENVYTEEEALQFFRDHPGTKVSLGFKWDGISASLRYSKGILVQALTRGDGDAGEDITAQTLACKDIPLNLTDWGGIEFKRDDVYLHGELLIASSTMEALNAGLIAAGDKPYSSTRNLVAGTMKLKDLELVTKRKVQFQPFSVLGKAVKIDSMQARLEILGKSGFRSTDEVLVRSEDELTKVLAAKLTTIEESKEFGCDGVVIKLDSVSARERVGVGSKNANYAVAFKPQNMAAVTTVKAVEWATSRGGRIVPTAVLEPVVLGGATIERATLNNRSWILAMGVTVGCTVDLVRSGDVIPKITGVHSYGEQGPDFIPVEVRAPETCSDCGTTITTYIEPKSKIETSWCLNISCPGRISDMLTHVSDRTILEIDSLGPEMAAKLTRDHLVLGLPDLFEWAAEVRNQIDERGEEKVGKFLASQGYSYLNVVKLIDAVERAKTTTWDRWLAALCIPMFGRRMGKVLAAKLRLEPGDFANLPEKLLSLQKTPIEGIGPLKLAELVRNVHDPIFVNTCRRLFEAAVRPTPTFTPEAASNALEGTTFLITGELLQFGEREYITKKLEELGAIAKTGVSKKVNLVIVGSMAGPTKIAKAVALGIKQVGEEWLNDVFTRYNIERSGVSLDAEFVE